MILGIIIGIVLLIVGSIVINTGKDSKELIGTSLDEKFKVIINLINNSAFNGEGEINEYDKKHIYLINPVAGNQLVEFLYSQGMLSITWKYKYFQKELIHRRNFSNVRNLSLFEQEKIANSMIEEMQIKVHNHKNNVLNSD